MKKAKIAILLCTVLCLLFVGCREQTQEVPVPYDDTKDKLLEESGAKISYYEELVVTMQQQIMDLKSALYTSRAEYDALYALYQASDKDAFDTSAGNPVLSKDFRYVKENDFVTITSYTGNDKNVAIPSSIEGLPVRKIADRAFSHVDSLESVTVPDGIEEIGWFAFSGCAVLQRVELPKTVERIAYGAFENCHKDLIISAPKDSYAAAYAASYGIRTQ